MIAYRHHNAIEHVLTSLHVSFAGIHKDAMYIKGGLNALS